MHRSAVCWLLAIGLGLASASTARAQFGVANLTHADGAVTRLHGGAPAATTIDVSLIDGDQIETAAGRAEVTFVDGTIVSLDRDTQIILGANDGFELRKGRVSLRTTGFTDYRVTTAAAKLLVQAGSVVDVKVKASGVDTFLNVISGTARIDSPMGEKTVPAYYTATIASAAAAPLVTKTAVTQSDEFGRWTLARTVMATSTALKGTENGGGVAYAPWYYGYYGSPGYGYPSYGSGYYDAPYYGSYSSSYYSAPYYTRPYSNLYYAAPYSYYNPYSYSHQYRSNGNYPGYRSPGDSWRGFDGQRPMPPIARPTPSPAPSAGGTSRGAVRPRP